MNSSDIAFYAGIAAPALILVGLAYILINKPDPVKQNAAALRQLDHLYQEVVDSTVLSRSDAFAAARYLLGLRSLFIEVSARAPQHQLATNLRFIIEENLPYVIGLYLSIDTASCAPEHGVSFQLELMPFERQLDEILQVYQNDLNEAAAKARQDINWDNQIVFTL